jgi:hypothetical protein
MKTGQLKNGRRTLSCSTGIWLMTFAVMLCAGSCRNQKPAEKPNDRVIVDGKPHVFSIGEISCSGGTTTIELVNDGPPMQVKGSFTLNSLQGGSATPAKFVSPIKMAIIVDGQRIECNNDIAFSKTIVKFDFATSKAPDKIIVYSNDELKSTVFFDGKAKRIIGN